MRKLLIRARHARKWTQKELADRLSMVQTHISEIETGKVSPRYNTILELVRALDYDLILVPRTLVPVVDSMIRDHARSSHAQAPLEDDQPLYAFEHEPDEEK